MSQQHFLTELGVITILVYIVIVFLYSLRQPLRVDTQLLRQPFNSIILVLFIYGPIYQLN